MIDMEMLRRKEQGDLAHLYKEQEKRDHRFEIKKDIQSQMIDRERLREDAYQEYLRERGMVDNTVQRLINEDLELLRINKMK